MPAIPLKAKDGSVRAHALVDQEDFERFGHLSWSLNAGGYASRKISKHECIYLHRVILGLTKGDGNEVDHRNGDKTDNRRSNLRVVSHKINLANRTRLNSNNTTGFRGVSEERGRFRAYYMLDGRQLYFGTYDTPTEASAAAERARSEYEVV